MNLNEEAVHMINSNNLSPLEVYKLIEEDQNLSKLFWFKGDKVKYSKEEYQRILEGIHQEK